MVKDRLGDLLKVQNHHQTDIELEKSPTPNSLRETFERTGVIDQWCQQIDNNIKIIQTCINQFNDVKVDQKSLQERIQSIFQNNTTIAKQVSAKLKEIELGVDETRESNAEIRIVQIQHQGASRRFRESFTANNSLMEKYRDMQKRQIRAQLTAKGDFQVTDEELTSLLDEGKDIQVFTDNIISETLDARRILQEVEERHQHLLKIERMLHEVHDMFLQMSILVENQQELIDRIEYQAESANAYVSRGTNQLEHANASKKRGLKLKICIFAIVASLLIIIIVSIVTQFT